jgi:hypothetical protein
MGAGDVYEGETFRDVLQWMIDPPGFTMNVEKDPDKYMVWCLDNLRRGGGKDLKVSGETQDERIECFFRLLMENGLACFVN